MYAVFQNTGEDKPRELSLKALEETGALEEFNPGEIDDSVESQRDFSPNPRKKNRSTGVARNRRIASKKRNQRRR